MNKQSLFKRTISKQNFLLFLKQFILTLLIFSPVPVFFGLMFFYQLSFPDEKNPFVQFSGRDPRTEAIITWETNEKEKSTVWYGIERNNLNWKKTNNNRVNIHRIILTGLKPNTKYYYRVGIDGLSPIYRSSISSFKTAPSRTDVDFEFIAYSDTQQIVGIGWNALICKKIAEQEGLSFVADVGDICQNWDYKPDWNQFFQEASIYTNKYPFVPCIGNHDGYYPEEDPENNKHYYKSYFGATVDQDKFYYSFNWANTLFVVAEISKTSDEDISIERNFQHDLWLNRTLAKGQDKTFRILMLHRQIFSSEENNEKLIARIVPIVEKYNVSLVLYGHHHHYERFLYNGRTYLCLGGGGGQQYGSNFFKTTQYTKNFALGPSYTKISIKSAQINILTFSAENDLIDNCSLILRGSKAILEE